MPHCNPIVIGYDKNKSSCDRIKITIALPLVIEYKTDIKIVLPADTQDTIVLPPAYLLYALYTLMFLSV